MSLFSAAVAQAAALPLPALLPPPALADRSVVIVAAGGRDLVWPQERIASALLQRSGGRAVHLLLHGGARGADQAIGRAAHQLGWRVQSLDAEWRRYGRCAGPIRNRRLLEQALVEAQAHTSPAFSASVLVKLGESRACGRHGQTEPMGSAWRRRQPKRCGCRCQTRQSLRCCSGPGRCIAALRFLAAAGAGRLFGRHRCCRRP